MIDLETRFSRAFDAEPALQSPTALLHAARRSRMRFRAQAGVASLAVAGVALGGVAVAGELDSPNRVQRERTPVASPSEAEGLPTQFPAKRNPEYSGEAIGPDGKPAPPPPGPEPHIWIDRAGAVYRESADVEIVSNRTLLPILNVQTGEALGKSMTVETRRPGPDGEFSSNWYRLDFDADGRLLGSTSTMSRGDHSELDLEAPAYVLNEPKSRTTFTNPVGPIAPDGSLTTFPDTDRVKITQESEATIFNPRRFDGAKPPRQAVVTLWGRTYYVLAGFRADGFEEVVIHFVAGDETLEEWLTSIKGDGPYVSG